MTCPDRNTLMAWCDNEIVSPEADHISEHIKHCDSCRAFTIAQKQMESVWRDAWTDPGEVRFAKMRSSVKQETPWWRSQRTWFIAAAICAAYIGVKVFYIDGTGTSLSSIALQETPASVQVTTTDISADQDESFVVEMEETAAVECAEEEFEIPQDELVAGQSEASEVIEELSVDLSLTESGSDVVFNSVEGYRLMNSEDSPEPLETADEVLEQEAFSRIATACPTESAGSGMVGEGLSGGVGGGGSAAYGSVGTSILRDSDHQCDDSIEDAQTVLPVQSEIQLTAYIVSVTLESKEDIQIQRFQWNSLFLMIDTLLEDNWNRSVEMLVFTVSSQGILSGDNMVEGTVIDIPEAGYGDCTVTVQFF